MSKKNPVVHFEMPAEDTNRMSTFYNSAFGWETKVLGEEMGNYVLVTTTETDERQMPVTTGCINGGFYPKTPEAPHPSLVIEVENINDIIKKIKDAGGTVLGEPQEIPGFGMYVSFNDTEGNRVSLMEPFMGVDTNQVNL